MHLLTPSSKNHHNPDSLAIQDYLAHLIAALQNIDIAALQEVIQVLFRAWQDGRQIFLFGNGGSAATASHMANDLNKLTIAPGKKRMKAIALTDNMALITAWANDDNYRSIFIEQLKNYFQPGDVLIGISTSGHSANVLEALRYGYENQGISIGFTGDDGGELKHLVAHCVYIPDAHIGRQEDGHMILDHIISNTLRDLIAQQD